MLKQSKTQQALAWLDKNPGVSVYAAAKKFGLSPTTLYTAIARKKARGEVETCKCCGQVIKKR